ncbi:MAG TPA: hypothetical protein VLE26_09890 [Alphaproteobacteria bacterium]|nr:hypothetical protein [Alphaproteobacteria bacterium]
MVSAALAACGAFTTTVPPPSDGLRQAMRGMEVTVTHASLADSLERPVAGAGEGAALGAMRGAGGSIYVGAHACEAAEPFICLIGLTLGVMAAPFVGAVGAVAGSVAAHDKDEVLAAHDRLLSAAATLDPVQGLQDAVAAASPRYGPAGPGSSAKDIRLQLAIEDFGLSSAGTYEPDVWVVMTVSGRVVRGADNEELYWRVWSYQGPRVPYFSLAAAAPDSLNRVAEAAYRSTAERLLYDLLAGSVNETLPGNGRTVSTVAAKYMRHGSELREYEMSDALDGGALQLTAGRPARWPDLPVDETAPIPPPPPEPEPVVATLPSPAPPVASAPAPLAAAATPAETPEAAPQAVKPSLPPADGRWKAATSNWNIRVELENRRFEGNALCEPRNQRYRISGRIAKDGTIEGSGSPTRATFEHGGIHIAGRWPVLVMPARIGCVEASVPLDPA